MIEEKIFRLTEEKLTNAERQIICLLKKAGAKTNKEISDLLGKDQGNISKKMKSLLEKGFVTVRRYHKGTSNFKEYSLVNSHFLTFPETIKKIYQTMEEFVGKLSFLTPKNIGKKGNTHFSNFLCGETIFSIQNKNPDVPFLFIAWNLNEDLKYLD